MSRDLRIQFPGAIYHVTSRGNRRQDIVVDDLDRDTFFQRIGKTVERFDWQMFAAVLMTNHFHLFFRTPQPNLSDGMQFLLGGYATWWNNRHHRIGHVFQGRFGAKLVENETYFWSVSRYAHLNPVPVLVERPEQWKWSTYAGYVDPRYRLPWVEYQAVLDAWQGTYGGVDATQGYRDYVEQGLVDPLQSPFEQAIDGWILGSEEFAERIREQISPSNRQPSAAKARQKMPLDAEQVRNAVCEVLDTNPSALSVKGNRDPSRAIYAYLSHRYTDMTLTELAKQLGLSRPDSVPTQLRRITRASPGSELRQRLALVEEALGLFELGSA